MIRKIRVTDICQCLCVNCLRRPQNPQERSQPQQRQYRHHCDRSGSDHQRPGHRLSQPALIAGSVCSGHNYAETVSQCLGKHDHQVKDRDVCPDRCQRLFSQKVPHNCNIHCIVKLLKYIRYQDRQHENKKIFHDRAADQIDLSIPFLYHLILCHSGDFPDCF